MRCMPGKTSMPVLSDHAPANVPYHTNIPAVPRNAAAIMATGQTMTQMHARVDGELPGDVAEDFPPGNNFAGKPDPPVQRPPRLSPQALPFSPKPRAPVRRAW
jgi:hypothetical protein